ncbi:acyl-CoA N-acyltransferase [Obelidium mucronatum]|nr:acyl-CoA N-acyltransferase [Obelidium mucronatum]
MPQLQPLLEPTILQVPGSSGRIILTFPMTAADDADQLRTMTSPEFLEHLPMMNPNMTLADIAARREKQAADGIYKVFRINKKETGEYIGSCGMYRIETDNLAYDCGLGILGQFHRLGYASEALFLILDHGFNLGFNRTTFVTSSNNIGMRKWLENALGAKLEGTMRQAWRDDRINEWVDSVMYSVLKSEWEAGMRERLLTKVQSYVGVGITNNQK